MDNNTFSFDFNNVEVNAPSIADIPVDVFLACEIDKVDTKDWGGGQPPKLQVNLIVTTPDAKQIPFPVGISDKQAFILAQFLDAVGVDYKSLSGQALTAPALNDVLAGKWVDVRFQHYTYQDASGQSKTRTRTNRIQRHERPAADVGAIPVDPDFASLGTSRSPF